MFLCACSPLLLFFLAHICPLEARLIRLVRSLRWRQAARQLVQQKAVIASSWCIWYDNMRASVPPKLWPLPGEVLPLTPEQRAARRSEAGTVPADVNYRFEPGGAAEWLAASWEDWLNDRPVWLTEEWRLGIPGHFLPAAARVPAVDRHRYGKTNNRTNNMLSLINTNLGRLGSPKVRSGQTNLCCRSCQYLGCTDPILHH